MSPPTTPGQVVQPTNQGKGAPIQESAASDESVAILLCTHNGAKFLPEQLGSLSAQTHTNWRLVASDDGSTDATRDILAQYKSTFSSLERVEIRDGPRRGAAANFMSLAADSTIPAEYVAYCDQDDIWSADKLERALAWLRPVPSHTPAMYGSRTRAVTRHGHPLHISPRFRKPATFRNALVQSLVGGNTIVMNKAAHSLLVGAGPVEVVAHDWWTYLLVSGAGGTVLYDPSFTIDYRQHGDNQIGTNQGLSASFRRLRFLIRGQLVGWNDINIAALESCEHLLTPENKRLLRSFCALRSAPFFTQMKLWRHVRPYRQTRLGNLALLLALLTRRF